MQFICDIVQFIYDVMQFICYIMQFIHDVVQFICDIMQFVYEFMQFICDIMQFTCSVTHVCCSIGHFGCAMRPHFIGMVGSTLFYIMLYKPLDSQPLECPKLVVLFDLSSDFYYK